MAKIGFFILTSKDQLFLTTAKMLKEHYNNIIKANNLDAEVYLFMGSETDKDTYEEGGIIFTEGSDNDLFHKHDELFKYILKNKKYDFIISANSSTLVNLKLLYDEIDTLNTNSYYATLTWPLPMKEVGDYQYPNGNFKMFSYDMLVKMSEQWKHCHDLIVDEYTKWRGTFITPDVHWIGVPDDMLIGTFLNLNNIEIIKLNSMVMFPYNTAMPKNLDIPVEQLPVIQFKMPFTRAARMYVEPYLLIYLTKILENYYSTIK